MIIPIYYGTNKFMFQRTNQDWCNVKILAGNWLDFPMEKNIMFLSFYWFKVLQSKDDNVFPQKKKGSSSESECSKKSTTSPNFPPEEITYTKNNYIKQPWFPVHTSMIYFHDVNFLYHLHTV